MKNKFLLILVLFSLILTITNINSVYSQDTNDTNGIINDDLEYIEDRPLEEDLPELEKPGITAHIQGDLPTEIEITQMQSTDEIINSELRNFSSSSFALKIRLTHLLNSVDRKIEHLNIIINKLEENGINNIEINTNLDKLLIIEEEIISKIDSNETYTQEDLTTYFVSIKKESNEIINNTKYLLLEILDPQIIDELRSELNNYKFEIRKENKERIRNLIIEHNKEIRNRYRKIVEQKIKSKNLNNKTIQEKNELKKQIINETKLQVRNQINEKITSQKKYILENQNKLEEYKQKRELLVQEYKNQISNYNDSNLSRIQKLKQIKNLKKQINNNISNNMNQGDVE